MLCYVNLYIAIIEQKKVVLRRVIDFFFAFATPLSQGTSLVPFSIRCYSTIFMIDIFFCKLVTNIKIHLKPDYFFFVSLTLTFKVRIYMEFDQLSFYCTYLKKNYIFFFLISGNLLFWKILIKFLLNIELLSIFKYVLNVFYVIIKHWKCIKVAGKIL